MMKIAAAVPAFMPFTPQSPRPNQPPFTIPSNAGQGDAQTEPTVRARENWRNGNKARRLRPEGVTDCPQAHNGRVERRVLGSSTQLFMTLKMSLGCETLTVKLNGRPETPPKRERAP
jgi:hypothetical protein